MPVPTPAHGQVLLKVKASSICGSDIRAIYREHLGHGPEAYQDVIAGHEPCGQIVAIGPGCKYATGIFRSEENFVFMFLFFRIKVCMQLLYVINYM